VHWRLEDRAYTDEDLKNQVKISLSAILHFHNRSLTDYKIAPVEHDYDATRYTDPELLIFNDSITVFDRTLPPAVDAEEVQNDYNRLTDEQRDHFDRFLAAVTVNKVNKTSQIYFIDAPGGYGRNFRSTL